MQIPFEYPDPLLVLALSLAVGMVMRSALYVRRSRDKMVYAVAQARFRQVYRELRSERERLREAYPDLYAKLVAAFFEVDPARVNFEENLDEYEPEVGTVLPRLSEAGSPDDVARILRAEFDQWFHGEYDVHRLQQLAGKTWDIWVSSPDRVTCTNAE